MVKVICADSWFLHRRFCLFPRKLYRMDGFEREDALRRCVNTPPREGKGLMRLPHVLLMAVDGSRVIARMMTCVDAEGNGFISLFDAYPDRDAVFSLLDEGVKWQRSHGGKRLLGPVAPDILDLEPGILKGGYSEGAAFAERINPPYYGEYLEDYGFSVESEWHSYRLRTAQINEKRYRAAAEWAERRMLLKTQDLSGEPREMARVIRAVMEEEAPVQEDADRMVGQLQPFLARGMCPAVFDQKTGEAAGILIVIGDRQQKKTPRIVNLWVREKWRRKGAAALLFDAVLQEALRRGYPEIDVSFVSSDNLASLTAVQAAGGRLIHRFCRYMLEN